MTDSDSMPQEMAVDGEAVIEDASLPTMDEAMAQEMGTDVGDAGGGGEFMSEPAPSEDVADEEEYPDMEPLDVAEPTDGSSGAAAFEASAEGEGYVRLAVHVQGGVMEIVDASVVDGPLVADPDLTGQMVYQATVGDRRVAAEAFAELGQSIGFAPPDEPELGHHMADIDEFDFNVRIPREDLPLADLPALHIELLRPTTTTQLSEELETQPGVPFEQTTADAGVEMPDVVASVSGLDLDQLPPAAADSLRSKLS